MVEVNWKLQRKNNCLKINNHSQNALLGSKLGTDSKPTLEPSGQAAVVLIIIHYGYPCIPIYDHRDLLEPAPALLPQKTLNGLPVVQVLTFNLGQS